MKSKFLVVFVLFLSLTVSMLGCSGGEGEELKASVLDDTQYLISDKAFSCSAIKTGLAFEDISAKFVQFSNVTFGWDDPATSMYISAILIESTSDDFLSGKMSCAIAGRELLALNNTWYSLSKAVVGGPDITVPVSSTYPTGVYTPPKSVSLSCPITCGQIQTTNRPFTATATMKIIGYKIDKEGSRTPVSTTTYVTIENLF